MALQVRPTVEAKVFGRYFSAILQQQPDGLDGQCADRQRPIHGAGQFPQFADFQQPKHFDELAAAIAAQFTFQPSPQHAQTLGQIPIVEGFSKVQRPGLPLQQGQVMYRVVVDVFLVLNP